MCSVSIIIVNYKTVPLILNCLESVSAKTDGISYEVIVVDNNSGDGFQQAIQAKYPDVKCLPLSENIGFGRANNEGLKIAKGRNIFFLNPDTLLLNNAVKILSDYLDAHPEVGVCGGNLYDEEMKPTHSYRMCLPGIYWELNDLFHGLLDKARWGKNAQFNHTGRTENVGYITGADMMVRREVLAQVGSFSPKFFMYYEETELTFRIKKAGYAVVSVPEAEIQHLEGKSFGKQNNRKRIELLDRGRKQYYALCHSFPYRLVSDLLLICFLLSRLLCFAAVGKWSRVSYYRARLKVLNTL